MNTEIGILFCCRSEESTNPLEAMEHLKSNEELYWSAPFAVRNDKLSFPLTGLIHISKDIVRFKCLIKDIKKYDASDHLDSAKKPESWIKMQKDDPATYKSTIVFSKVESFNYETRELKDMNGQRIKNPPRGYQRIILP